MAVPNTNTFSLKDVQAELPFAPTGLQACFTNAIASAFDGAYSGSKNQLSNFRNYNSIVKTWYQLFRCGVGSTAYTLVPPTVATQRYVDVNGGQTYRYNNTFLQQSNTPGGYISTIIEVPGQTGCP